MYKNEDTGGGSKKKKIKIKACTRPMTANATVIGQHKFPFQTPTSCHC